MSAQDSPTMRTHGRGHRIATYNGTDWVYEDDGTPYDDSRACASCHKHPVGTDPTSGLRGADACLGWLSGVSFACCGHGIEGQEYVSANGVRYDSVAAWRAAADRAEAAQ